MKSPECISSAKRLISASKKESGVRYIYAKNARILKIENTRLKNLVPEGDVQKPPFYEAWEEIKNQAKASAQRGSIISSKNAGP